MLETIETKNTKHLERSKQTIPNALNHQNQLFQTL